MPKPMDTGIKPSLPMSVVISRAGNSKLKNEAATMTPEANPVSAL